MKNAASASSLVDQAALHSLASGVVRPERVGYSSILRSKLSNSEATFGKLPDPSPTPSGQERQFS